MKKNIVLGSIVALLLTITLLIGCQKTNNKMTEKTHTIGSTMFTAKTIATIDPITSEITLMFDVEDFKTYLLDSAYFTTVDSVELNYNDPASSNPSYLTIFGTLDTFDFAIQVELIVSGDDVIMIAPDGTNDDLVARHACSGNPCNSCRFERTWYFKIVGCNCRDGSSITICDYFQNDILIVKPDLYAFF